MNIEEIREKLDSKEYDFIRNNSYLGSNIILLGLGGSYAYGTNNEMSDIDIRGIATNTKRNILTHKDFEQVVDTDTDTTIYSFEKIIKLLCECNPNTIEILGLKPEHYLFISPVGKKLLRNKKIFLSKKAIYSFGGYANAQLRRLENKSARLTDQTHMENNILKSINHAEVEFKNKYFDRPDDAIKLYVDKAIQEGYDSEIFMDIVLKHYPLRDYANMWSEMNNIVKAYSKFGKRNKNAIEHKKLSKHMMHLIRLYLMCFEILEKGEICTFREKEHDFLMDIRNGKFLDENQQPTKEFYDILTELNRKLDYLSIHTDLPDVVEKDKIDDFVAEVNQEICETGEIRI